MTYDKQCGMIYDWYWNHITLLYTHWEHFLNDKYYSEKEKWKTLPRKEMFFITMFNEILDDEDSDYKRKDFPCLTTLLPFMDFESFRYKKRCDNLIRKPKNDEVFPNLLRLYFNKRRKMGHKKFEKYVYDTWEKFYESIDSQ